MTPPTEKPFEPTPERVQEVAKQMYCSLFPEPNCWPNIVNATYWKEAARWHLAELSTLRSQLDAASKEVILADAHCATLWAALRFALGECDGEYWKEHSPEVKAAMSLSIGRDTLSKIDALKAEVVRKDEALRFIANYQFDSEPVGGIMEMQEVAHCALTPAKEAGR